jgi:hypothetical protein
VVTVEGIEVATMRRPLARDRYADHRPRLVLVVADLVIEGADVPERAYLGGRRRLIALGAFVAVAAAVTACTAPSTPETSPSPSGALIIPAAPEGALPEETQAQLQQVLDDTVAEYGVPGAAVGVWLPDEGSWTTAVGSPMSTRTSPRAWTCSGRCAVSQSRSR